MFSLSLSLSLPFSLIAPNDHDVGAMLSRIQKPVASAFDRVNSDLKEVSKLQKAFGKTLDKVGWLESTLE